MGPCLTSDARLGLAWSAAFEPYRREGLNRDDRGAAPGCIDVLTADGEAPAASRADLRREDAAAELPVGRRLGCARLAASGRRWLARDARVLAPGGPRSRVGRRASRSSRRTSTSFRRRCARAGPRPASPRALRDAALESGARPVVLLTKADLEPDADGVAASSRARRAIPVHAVSTRAGARLDAVLGHLTPGVTGALLGASGVGQVDARQRPRRRGAAWRRATCAPTARAAHDDPS